MTVDEFAQILERGHETPGLEFKGPGSRKDKDFFAKVVRAALAMTNRRNGGQIVIGVGEDGDRLAPDGLSDKELTTWNHDDVTGAMSAYADPYVSASVEQLTHLDKNYAIIRIDEFEEVPVLCKREYPSILRDGACYVRRRGRIESSEIPNQAEMRDLVELATEKALRRFLRTASRAGLEIRVAAPVGDPERYDSELGDFD